MPILPGSAGEPATDHQTDEVTDSDSSRVTGSQPDEVTESQSPKVTESQPPKEPDSVSHALPKFRRLQRKETLIRYDQLEHLTTLQRGLNRKRRQGEGERITENTLIRVAIDLLISRESALAGSDEDELRRSLGL